MTVFDVFSSQLEYLGEVHAPGWISPSDLGYGTLAGVVRGELGAPIVKVWRVVEGRGTADLPAIGAREELPGVGARTGLEGGLAIPGVHGGRGLLVPQALSAQGRRGSW